RVSARAAICSERANDDVRDLRADQRAVEALARDDLDPAVVRVGRAEAELGEGEQVVAVEPAEARDLNAEREVSGGVDGDQRAFDEHLRPALVELADELLVERLH